MKIKMGVRYEDMFHGIRGVAVARTEYVNSCARVALEDTDENGNVREHWFDEPQLRIPRKKETGIT